MNEEQINNEIEIKPIKSAPPIDEPIKEETTDDDILFDLSSAKEKAKDLFKEEEEEPISEEEETIDFKKIKTKTKQFLSSFKGKETKTSDEEVSFDIKNVKKFWSTNQKWLLPVILILIAIIVSTNLRMMPSTLPITDSWAENTVHDFYQKQIQKSIDAQYPNLPQQNKQNLVNKELQKALQENKKQTEQDIAQLSQQYKSHFQDENGDTYLLAIDPYLWYSEARNVINHGHLGDTIIDGESYFSLRDGRLNKVSSVQLHPYLGAYFYKFLSFFTNISFMKAIFLMPPLIIGLAIIPAFFIGRRFGGNIGGFFSAMFLAVNNALLSRTPAGFSDTDMYSIFYPLMIGWLFLEAYHAKDKKSQFLLSLGSAFFVGLYAATWTGWSFIFLFVIATIIVSYFSKNIYSLFQKKTFNLKNLIWNKSNFQKDGFILTTFLIGSAVVVSLFQSFYFFYDNLTRTFRFTNLKAVGVKSIWPNVLTTVAEFNKSSFSSTISQLGGKTLFILAILGIILLLFRRNTKDKWNLANFSLVALWLVGTLYSTTKGIRFSLLVVPPLAIALGSAFGVLYDKVGVWLSKNISINKNIGKIAVFIVLLLFLITPFSSAQKVAINEVPSMNDAWYSTLTKIKNDSPDSIITSWWDFGHWFQSISERRVTFDGGDQGERIHWVGNTLLTNNEKESVGILRMLNCAQETAPHKLDEFTGDSLKSVQILYKVFTKERAEARLTYINEGLTSEQAETMLEYTHCQDLLPNYYITSQDMIGKAGVWGHFGSWNFRKATMYQNTKKKPREEAITYLVSNFQMTEIEADKVYNEIQTTPADQWISPWPGYFSGVRGCQQVSPNILQCIGSIQGNGIALQINTDNMDVVLEGTDVKPNSIVYEDNNQIITKKFSDKKAGFSVVLIKKGEGYNFMLTDPLQAASTFTKLFFFDGTGSSCFEKFDEVSQMTGGKIVTWKVNYQC